MLKEYKAKRKFNSTPEPKGKVEKKKGELRFVVQKHQASHLHYDFRLEMEGVLKSWAIPKGPSTNPIDKRLAMMVEDHPREYASFEGIIPEGNYGAGTVMIWDEGIYISALSNKIEESEKELLEGLKKGNLKFILLGKKLKGEFALVRLKRGKGNEWILIKKKDEYANDVDITQKDKSVVSKRSLEQIKNQSGKGDTVWRSSKVFLENEISLPKNLSKEAMPHKIKPMLSTLIDKPFDAEDWIYEIKWDGYRAIAEINDDKVSLYSRNYISFKKDYPEIVNALSALGVKAIFDGEICAVDENGKASFQLIQNYKKSGKGNIVYYVFDLIYYDGYDLKELPLVDRKNILKKIIKDIPNIRFSDHVEKDGIRFFEMIRSRRMEGIVAKRKSSKYFQGARGKDWLKIKVQQEQEAVIGGFTEPRRGRKYFGSLVLGVYEGDKLLYIGHSGGGFDEKSLKEIYLKLKALEISECPFEKIPKTHMHATWVKPIVVCEVKFQEWTDEGLMRQPIFVGLRKDKSAKEVKREIEDSTLKLLKNEKTKGALKIKGQKQDTSSKNKTENKKINRLGSGRAGVKVKNRKPVSRSEYFPEKKIKEFVQSESKLISEGTLDVKKNEAIVIIDQKNLKLTNLKKIFWPEEGYTKQDLIEYYDRIAPIILPYLKDRPENLRRNPNGYKSKSFFHKDMPSSLPDWIETVKVFSDTNDKEINYMICQDKAALIYIANLGCIEVNPWLSRKQSLEFPDYIVIDLDPQDVSFDVVVEVALAVKEILDKGKIEGYCKTSGSRGLHIYIPLKAKYHYKEAGQFAELIAMLTNKLIPKISSLERLPERRRNKVYLDYLQNRMGQTLAAPYCIRPRVGATVSTPLDWKEIKSGLDPTQFNIKTIFKRIEEKGDLFQGIMGKGVDVEKVLQSLKIK